MTTRPPHSRLDAPPEVLDDDPPVSSVMTTDVVTIEATARVVTALHLMASTGIRHLPVVERGRCVGLLVERDLVRHLAQGPGRRGPDVTATARQLRRAAPQLTSAARVSAAAELMSAEVTDAVLVVDQGRIRGIVTATDLVRLLAFRRPQRG